ncbi:hypothetical protein EXIGLDRAFT_720010 [Exidia glandulosa HHB12029]|uniref:F-box domain-containing protein n=1 Tax=Exidia glandulosa HHB12029 TaxID=1314781 RepID=A0A165NLY9_EXIGL|nr:hypothetical protein EXIGLDRAFT_720010 [Exidia glandulosa HHB12029]
MPHCAPNSASGLRRRGVYAVQPFRLLSLPQELLTLVLAHLDHIALTKCLQTCSQLRDHIRSSMLLQCRIALGKEGLIDITDGSLSTADMVERVSRRRHNWAMLTPARMLTLLLEGDCRAYELVGGIFGKATMSFEGRVASHHLDFYTFPDGTDPSAKVHVLTHNNLGVSLRDFAIDPYQDLLVLVETEQITATPESFMVTVNLRTMSGNAQHALAKLPALEQSIQGRMNALTIHVLDDIVACFGWIHTNPHLLMWNWHQGRLLVSFALDISLGGFDDFTMLSSDMFMLTRLTPLPSLEIYRFQRDPIPREPPNLPPNPTAVLSLLLPPHRADTSYLYVGTHTGPFLTRRPDVAPFPPTRRCQTFEYDYDSACARRNRLHVISIAVRQALPGPGGVIVGVPFTMFVHNEYLLRAASQARGRSYADPEDASRFFAPGPALYSRGVPTLQWSAWGPEHTRVLADPHQPQWLRYVHGARFVRGGDVPHESGVGTRNGFVVLDFDVDFSEHKPGFAQYLQKKLVKEESVIPAGDLFANDVVSSLPYRESPRCVAESYSGYMVDEERILGLVTDTNANLSRIDAMLF